MQHKRGRVESKIEVLVIDDSLFMRTLICDMLNDNADLNVFSTDKKGVAVLNEIAIKKPTVIILDIVMPEWNGIKMLHHIMEQYPTPVIILSAYSEKGAEITIRCLEKGAIGSVQKPSGEVSLDIERVKEQLIHQITLASKISVKQLKLLSGKSRVKRNNKTYLPSDKIIVIGASTGGLTTIADVLAPLSEHFPIPIIIVQHAPSAVFAEGMAQSLAKDCALSVSVIKDKDAIQAGNVYLLPACYHLEFSRSSDSCNIMHLVKNDTASLKGNPSIDQTMQVVADKYKNKVVGVILTGMGQDGLKGMTAIKKNGGTTLSEDQSAILFGMPKTIIEAGVADRVFPAHKMANAFEKIASMEFQ
jgi:two-component system, chemotaxis family, protein-glutamate methylesterase/glutaminase